MTTNFLLKVPSNLFQTCWHRWDVNGISPKIKGGVWFSHFKFVPLNPIPSIISKKKTKNGTKIGKQISNLYPPCVNFIHRLYFIIIIIIIIYSIHRLFLSLFHPLPLSLKMTDCQFFFQSTSKNTHFLLFLYLNSSVAYYWKLKLFYCIYLVQRTRNKNNK